MQRVPETHSAPRRRVLRWAGMGFGLAQMDSATHVGTVSSLLLAIFIAIPTPVCANGLHTSNQFAVSEGGAATVTIPIQVPRGIGGMEPQLALNYSSGSGNGLLGLGWSLSGPSAVTRCPKSQAIDSVRGAVTFTVGDRYCLDGQRLVIVGSPPNTNPDAVYGTANTTYRTERDSFSRVTAVGTYMGQSTVPNSFKVETKSGLILEFGISDNSKVLTNFVVGVSTPKTINRWMLQRISDRHGSFVEFVYCAGEVSADGSTCAAVWSGSTVLHYVRYTNRAGALNGELAVVFGYQSRPDRIQVFHTGSASRQTQRIAKIETYRDFAGPISPQVLQLASSKLVRGYDVTYESLTLGAASVRATNTSRISQIQERDAGGNTLPPLSFTHAPDLVFDKPVAQTGTSAVGTPITIRTCGGVVGGRVVLMCP